VTVHVPEHVGVQDPLKLQEEEIPVPALQDPPLHPGAAVVGAAVVGAAVVGAAVVGAAVAGVNVGKYGKNGVNVGKYGKNGGAAHVSVGMLLVPV
jgi:hypothetical protein